MSNRAVKFNMDEVTALVEAVRPVYNKLMGSFSSALTADTKQLLWCQVTEAVNQARPEVHRTVNNVKDKWSYLARDARSAGILYNKSINKTGGGAVEKPPSQLHQDILTIIPKVTVDGLAVEGCESGVPARKKMKECRVDASDVANIINNTRSTSRCIVTKKKKAATWVPPAPAPKVPGKKFQTPEVPGNTGLTLQSQQGFDLQDTGLTTTDKPEVPGKLGPAPVSPVLDTTLVEQEADGPLVPGESDGQALYTQVVDGDEPEVLGFQEYLLRLQQENNTILSNIHNQLSNLNNNIAIMAQCMLDKSDKN